MIILNFFSQSNCKKKCLPISIVLETKLERQRLKRLLNEIFKVKLMTKFVPNFGSTFELINCSLQGQKDMFVFANSKLIEFLIEKI